MSRFQEHKSTRFSFEGKEYAAELGSRGNQDGPRDEKDARNPLPTSKDRIKKSGMLISWKSNKHVRDIGEIIKILLLILLTFSFYGCENYISNTELNSVLDKNDLNIELKLKRDKDHICNISSQTDDSGDYIIIDVENELSISSGEISVIPNKTYNISITMKNISSNPLVYYSFWKNSITQTRSFVLAGEHTNPPTSETQIKKSNWQTFNETFSVEGNEKELDIRIYSNSGVFYIQRISIEEI